MTTFPRDVSSFPEAYSGKSDRAKVGEAEISLESGAYCAYNKRSRRWHRPASSSPIRATPDVAATFRGILPATNAIPERRAGRRQATRFVLRVLESMANTPERRR